MSDKTLCLLYSTGIFRCRSGILNCYFLLTIEIGNLLEEHTELGKKKKRGQNWHMNTSKGFGTITRFLISPWLFTDSRRSEPAI